MSSNKFNPPLYLNLKPSLQLYSFIVITHFLALSVLSLSLDIATWVLFTIGIGILISLFLNLKNNNSVKFIRYITVLQYHTNDTWTLVDSKVQSVSARLKPNFRVFPNLIILYFEIENFSDQFVIVLPDMLNRQKFRSLRVFLNQV